MLFILVGGEFGRGVGFGVGAGVDTLRAEISANLIPGGPEYAVAVAHNKTGVHVFNTLFVFVFSNNLQLHLQLQTICSGAGRIEK